MKTPIVDFVKAYQAQGISRLHMPGHKGASFLGCEPYDITEIQGADDLYHPEGIIQKSECNATRLFLSGQTAYSTQGSTQGISAMLYMVSKKAKEMGKECHVLATRNVHRAFIHACALLDIKVTWLYGASKDSLCACTLTVSMVEEAIKAHAPTAVFVTSPDYLGNVQPLTALYALCQAHGAYLLVDNAHGAYRHFLPVSKHPLTLGCDVCCDSAHKTLPVVTGGAYLHVSKQAKDVFAPLLKEALSVFGSSSPSYITLQSLDLANVYLATTFSAQLNQCIKKVETLKALLSSHGWEVLLGEELKIVLAPRANGYTGMELADCLRTHQVECEYSDLSYVVLMLTPQNTPVDFERIEHALCTLEKRPSLPPVMTHCHQGEKVLSLREAMFAPSTLLCVQKAVGKVCANSVLTCPPAIALAVSGERITKETVAFLLENGVQTIKVIKEL